MAGVAPPAGVKRKTRSFEGDQFGLRSKTLSSSFDDEQLKFFSNYGLARKRERSEERFSLMARYAKNDDMLRWIDSFRPRCVELMKTFRESFEATMHVDIYCAALHLFDAYVASPETVSQPAPLKDFKLAALVALWVSAKVNKTNAKRSEYCKVSHIMRISNYEKKEIYKAEREFLRRIEYRCTQPSASLFLKDYIREYFGRGRPKCFERTLLIARHKLEKVIGDRAFFFAAPSKIAFGIARYSIEMYEDKSIHDNGHFHTFVGYDADCYEDILSSRN